MHALSCCQSLIESFFNFRVFLGHYKNWPLTMIRLIVFCACSKNKHFKGTKNQSFCMHKKQTFCMHKKQTFHMHKKQNFCVHKKQTFYKHKKQNFCMHKKQTTEGWDNFKYDFQHHQINLKTAKKNLTQTQKHSYYKESTIFI